MIINAYKTKIFNHRINNNSVKSSPLNDPLIRNHFTASRLPQPDVAPGADLTDPFERINLNIEIQNQNAFL